MFNYFKKNIVNIITFGATVVLIISSLSCGNDNSVSPSQTGGRFTLSIDTGLDDEGNIVITDSIIKADLYKFSAPSTIVKSATVSGGVASFNMSGLSNGNYFMVVNDSSGERLPTYIADNTQNYNQKVGRQLRISLIFSNSGDTLYKLKAHTQNQGEHEVVKYSNNQGTGRYMYALVTYSAKTLDLHYLDDASIFNNLVESGASYHRPIFSSWILGKTNHGTGPNGDSLQVVQQCYCHSNFWIKPAQWSQISVNNGWCNRCHTGYQGDGNGFYDRNQ